jgi:DNA topoisomerase-1
VIEPVAEALGNTPAMSKKAYVHPELLEALKEHPRDPLHGMARPAPRKRLSTAEAGLLEFLARRSKPRRKAAA